MGITHSPIKFNPSYYQILDEISKEIPHAFLIFAYGERESKI